MISVISQKLFEVYCRIVLHTYIRVKTHGKEYLPDQQYILVSNHNSHLDYLILSIFSGKGFAKMSVIAAQDYWFDNPLRDRFIKLFLNAIPISRKKLFQPELMEQVVQECKTELSDSNSLVVFPEGKRALDGEMQPFKQGAAIIAHELGFPIVPAYIADSYHAWPKGRLLMTPKKLNLYFGKPILPEELANKDSKALTRLLEEKVKTLANQHHVKHTN